MFVTLNARLGLTEAALAEAPVEALLRELAESLTRLPSRTLALKDISRGRAKVSPGLVFEPTDFTKRISVDFKDFASLPGDDDAAKEESARAAIREALGQMDMVQCEDVRIIV